MLRSPLLWVAVAAILAGCRRGEPRDDELVQAVRRYLARSIESYRIGDPERMREVAGPDEYRKVGALVGVKGDLGLTMDSQLLDLAVEGVRRSGDGWTVTTRERWYWVDRRIGTGQPVGEGSTDEYHVSYALARRGGRILVERVEFASPPKIGHEERRGAPARVFH